jgi:glycosyltransferase involved in cell wall biosynthesis
MAKALANSGYNVTVVAASTTHKRSIKKNKPLRLKFESHDSVKFIFLPAGRLDAGRTSRAVSMLMFVLSLMIFSRKILKIAKPNIVIEATTYILPIFSSAWIAKKSKAKLIYEVRDLWPASPIEISGKSKHHPFFIIIALAQRYAVKYADSVVSTLRYADQYFTQNVLKPNSFFHIQNGIDLDFFEKKTEKKGKTFHEIHEIKQNYKGCVGYTGSFGDANGIQTLLGSAPELAKEKLAIVLVGRGIRKLEFENYVALHKLTNVFIFDAVSKNEIAPITKLFDIGYSGGVKRLVHDYGISPNKVFDYMMAGVPLLLCYNTRDNFLEEIGCCVTVRNPDASSVSSALKAFFNTDAKQRKIMGLKGREAVMSNYEYKTLAQSYADVFNSLAKGTEYKKANEL